MTTPSDLGAEELRKRERFRVEFWPTVNLQPQWTVLDIATMPERPEPVYFADTRQDCWRWIVNQGARAC